MRKLLKIEAAAPAGADEELTGKIDLWLNENAPQGWEESAGPDGRAVYRLFFDDFPPGRALAAGMEALWPGLDVTVEEIEEEDWGAAWMEFFTPIEVGGVYEVLPPWLAKEARADKTPIIIEPKMAFGTGHHATTALCMEIFSDWIGQGKILPGTRFLDVGTGSGILGISLCRFGCAGIGVDIDPQAVYCAAENAALNKVEGAFSLAVGSVDCVDPDARFQVIAANILAGPLLSMAGHIVSRMAPDGMLVLSGILEEQAPKVAAAYMARGLGEPVARISGEWAALAWG